MKILKIALGLIVPPVGVFLTVGISTALIINIVLTLLGWLPGAIHAMWIISKQPEEATS